MKKKDIPQVSEEAKKRGPKPKPDDGIERIYRHFGIPKSMYEDMEQENLMDKKKTGDRISTEQTLVTLIGEAIQARKGARANEMAQKLLNM